MRDRMRSVGAMALLTLTALAGAEPPQAAPPAEPYEFAAADRLRRFGVAEAPEAAPDAIRVTTYNIANLFDGVDDPELSGRFEDADDTKPEAERKAAARAIRLVDADVLCLQEVESLEALLEFRDQHLSGMGYEHVISIDAGDERGIEQSVLSRFPLSNARSWPREPLGGTHPAKYGNAENWYAGQPIVFHRSPLVVDVTVPAGAAGNEEAYTFAVAVVHHKSGRHSAYWREAEAARTVRKLAELMEQDPSANVLLLGDFNAEAGDASVKAYLRAGFTDVLEPRSGGPERWVSHESGRTIDLILASPTVVPEIVAGTGFVLGTPARPEGVDWRDVPTFEGFASDHYPVSIDLRPVERGGGPEASAQPGG